MNKLTTVLRMIVFIATISTGGSVHATIASNEQPFVFETWSKHKIEALRGVFMVPENRKVRDSRMIPIRYVRLPATGDTNDAPIVYLAGGPGGSGIQAINYRYQMFMYMRRYGDVIALDQRGTGASNVIPECRSHQIISTARATSDQKYATAHRAALKGCLAFWKHRGVDLAGYNTVQNARDLDALRQHLGADEIILWGTSYGSHLALAALKEMEAGIARVVLSSVEGLDQTIKQPARTDAYLGRLQQAIDSQPKAKAAYPDIKALMHRVHAKLDRKPVLLKRKTGDGATFNYLLQRRNMQVIASSLISDPDDAARLLGIYGVIDRGSEPSFAGIPARKLPESLFASDKPILFDGMPIAMDLASGMTADHRSIVTHQARTAILGTYLNYTLQFDGVAPELDLGDDFRAAPVSDVPVLVLSGTLDGRTYVEGQREAVSGLRNATIITIRNAGHNLFDDPTKEMLDSIDRFMRGKAMRDATISVDLPNMAPQER